jgi:biopolymer transport protein TolR
MAFGKPKRDTTLSFTPAGVNAPVCVADGAELWSPLLCLRERTRKRRSEYFCRIDATGLASIFWTLLFVLMAPAYLGTDMAGPSADLPRITHSAPLPAALRDDAMWIVVKRDGQIYFGHHRITADELPEQIRGGLRGGAEKRIYILADARAKYLDVKNVLDRIREAGVERVSFLTN